MKKKKKKKKLESDTRLCSTSLLEEVKQNMCSVFF